jgi:hypothetical protein
VWFHIHAHLTVFVDGTACRVPYGIGIPGAQVSPTPAGPYVAASSWADLVDVWGQTLGPHQVGPATGTVTALYNGRVFRRNPRDIP